MVTSDLEEKACSPGIPEDMKILYDDVEELRHCCFALSVKQALHDIQNATAHEIVSMCIHKLQRCVSFLFSNCFSSEFFTQIFFFRYFLLYSIAKTLNGKNCNDTTSATVLSHMLWESTLERFMLSMPACIQDESLLLSVIQFIQTIIESFKSERLINWVEKLLIDVHKPLHKILKNLGNETCQFRKSGLKVF